jgi:hypothetical protein|nr:MAG TPA: hypothetical protein [Caudoviricetes sp.]
MKKNVKRTSEVKNVNEVKNANEVKTVGEVMQETGTLFLPVAPSEEQQPAQEPTPEAVHTVETPVTEQQTNEAKPKTMEEVQREIEMRRIDVQKMQEAIERKQELFGKRRQFLKALDNVKSAQEMLQAEENFDSEPYRLKLVGGKYGNEVFSIANPEIVSEIVDLVACRIENTIFNIEQEILK